ncbi:yfjD [Symbiodinium microadriaticum]|nr:yfjD [Symbiodinium microadriaticum]
MHHLENRGNKRARLVSRLVNDNERLLGAILLGNNLVNILASALATSLFLSLFGDAGVAYATLVMTALVVVFAEVLPKTFAISNADRVALIVSPVIGALVKIFGPIILLVQAIVGATLKLLGLGLNGDSSGAIDEIRGAIDLHHKEGRVKKGYRDMLGSILDLRDVEVDEVMVHRRNIIALDADAPPTEILAAILESPYTRIPLYRGSSDNIVGILHAKDLLRAVAGNGAVGELRATDILDLAADPWFVPETTSLAEQLTAFQQKQAHMALVVDEYGELMGLVTLEDIIEEIVGDISDEHDEVVVGVRPQAGGIVNVDGAVTIRDLNRALDWNLPDEEANTIAGLVIHEARTIPNVGQTFMFHGFRFEVMRKQRNQITTLRGQSAIVTDLLNAVPDWFGQPASNAAYARQSKSVPMWAVGPKAKPDGFLTLGPLTGPEGLNLKEVQEWLGDKNPPTQLEIAAMAVRPGLHRKGTGRALADAAIAYARRTGWNHLFVRTLGPSEVYEPYARTRAFYHGIGFTPLVEDKTIWGSDNPTLILGMKL